MLVLLLILKLLLYILLILLGLILLLLIIPFNYSGQVLAAEGVKAELAVGWAWKFLGINAEIEGEAVDVTLRVLDKRVYKLKSGRTQEEEKPRQQEEKKEKEKNGRKGFGLKDLADREFIGAIIAYSKKVLDMAKPKYFHIYGTYGFDDPSLTGIACGITGMIKAIIPHAKLKLTPDFTQEIIDLDVRADGSMTLGGLAYQTVRTVLKKPVRKILFRSKKN